MIPGGHIEFGESIRDAVIRESKEEIGAGVEYERIITVAEDIFPESFHVKKHFIYLQCKANILPRERVKIDNKEVTEARWRRISDALKLGNEQIHPLVRETLSLVKTH